MLQIINVMLVTGVNVLYILVENSSSSRNPLFVAHKYKVAVPIALGVFKTFWANTFIFYIAQYGVRSKLSVEIVFINYFFAMVYIFMLVPIVTVYFTDVDCFYYRFFGNIDKITKCIPGYCR